jgi:hypothetical protein
MSRWLLLTAVLSGCGGVPVRAELQPLDVRVEVVAPQVDPLGATEAELVALRVRARRSGAHAALPGAVQGSGLEPDAWPRVRFVNDTRYGIVVWVSGPCAREVVLPPSGEHEAEVCEGSYEVAAQVDARGIVPLVGESTEFMDGHAYTYTIFVTSGGRRRRPGPR